MCNPTRFSGLLTPFNNALIARMVIDSVFAGVQQLQPNFAVIVNLTKQQLFIAFQTLKLNYLKQTQTFSK